MMLWSWCVALLWGAPAWAAPEREAQRVHRDSAAGVKFEIPFSHFDIVSGKAVQAAISANKGPPPPADMTFTSGIIAKGGSPYLVVWTRPHEAPLTRPSVDQLASGQGKASDALNALGFKTFQFSTKMLTGIGELPVRDGQRTKIAMRLLKDHTAYIAYYFRKESEAKAFDKVTSTLRSSRRVGIRYEDLPLQQEGSWMPKLLGLLSGAAIGAAILALTLIFYRSMQESRVLADAPLPPGLGPPEAPLAGGLAGLRAMAPVPPEQSLEANPGYGEPSVTPSTR